MAKKEVKRPTGLIPSWSNDLNLADPPEAWDGTATKVEPGVGKRDDGFLPDEDVPAQHVNHLLNELGKWVQFFSDIQVQNWLLPADVNATNTGNYVVWDEASKQYFFVGDHANVNDARADRSSDAASFISVDQIGVAGNDLQHCFSKPPLDAPGHTGSYVVAYGATDREIAINRVFSWSSSVASPSSRYTSGVWEKVSQLLLVGGFDSGFPRFYNSDSLVISWNIVIPAQVSSTQVVDMATDGAGLTLAIGDQVNGDTWTSTDGLLWTLRTTAIDDMRACWYNAEEALWMITTDNRCYTSTDAINWSLVSTLANPFSGAAHFQVRCLRAEGSLWLATDDSTSRILFSVNSGLVWRSLYIPQNGASFAVPSVPWTGIAYSPQQRKFVVTARNVGGGHVNQSLSVGTVLFSETTATDSPPVVT